MSEYSNPSWLSSGETYVPPPVPMSQSTRNSPHPWGNYNPNYTAPPNTVANNLGSVIHRPQPDNRYEAIAPPYHRGGLWGTLKTFLSRLLADPDSEIVAFHTESCVHGKTRVTVTFETSGEM